MKRREFIALVGCVAVSPLAAHARQSRDRVRRIGVLVLRPNGGPGETT